jgi:RNA polymerase sigma-70 factor (ECF subfamily)
MGVDKERRRLAMSRDLRELARQLRKGSPEAVRVVQARVRRILGFRGYRIPAVERQDLEQEIMTQVWQAVNRTGFDPELGFWKFIEVVTARRCIDWLRASREETELPAEVEAEGGPEKSALAGERVRLAYAALSQLGKPCRDLIYLRIGMNRSYRELATLLGRSEGALRVQMHRCVERARGIVAEMSRGDSSDWRREGG